MSEPKRGGARPGAGRPATGKTTEYITLTLPKELAQKIRTQAKERNMTLSAYCIESLDRFANMNDEGQPMFNLLKYGFYGVILLMLLMAASAFLDVFTAKPKVSEAYKERTVVHTPAPYDLHTYNPDRKIYKLWKEEK